MALDLDKLEFVRTAIRRGSRSGGPRWDGEKLGLYKALAESPLN